MTKLAAVLMLGIALGACSSDFTDPVEVPPATPKVFLVTLTSDQPMPENTETFVSFGKAVDTKDPWLGMQDVMVNDNREVIPVGAIIDENETISVALTVNEWTYIVKGNNTKPVFQFTSDWSGSTTTPAAIKQKGPDKFSFFAIKYDPITEEDDFETYDLTGTGPKIIAPVTLPADGNDRFIFPRQIKSFQCNGDGSMKLVSPGGVSTLLEKVQHPRSKIGMKVHTYTLTCTEYSSKATARMMNPQLSIGVSPLNLQRLFSTDLTSRPFLR